MDRRADSTLTFIRNEVKLSKFPGSVTQKRIRLKHFFTGLFLIKGCFFPPVSPPLPPPFPLFFSPRYCRASLIRVCTHPLNCADRNDYRTACYCGALTSIRCDSLFELFRGKNGSSGNHSNKGLAAFVSFTKKEKRKRKRKKKRKEKERKKREERARRAHMCSAMDAKSMNG